MDTQIGHEQLQYAVWAFSYLNQIPSRYAQNRIWADSLNEVQRLKITLQNILVHYSWPVEWYSLPYPEWWIPVNLQATTENSSHSTLLDFIPKKKKKTLFL